MRTGEHTASVVEHKLNWSANGTLGVRVLFQLEDTENETIWADIWLSEKAMHIARKSLKAIGFDVDNEKDLAVLTDQPTYLLGKRAKIEVDEEIYGGKSRLKVKWINPLDNRPAGDFRVHLAKAMAGLRDAKKKETPSHVVEDPGAEESDIPF